MAPSAASAVVKPVNHNLRPGGQQSNPNAYGHQ